MMYGENGRRFIGEIWKETLEELSFARVEEVLQTSKD